MLKIDIMIRNHGLALECAEDHNTRPRSSRSVLLGNQTVSSWRLVTLKAVGGAGERWEVLGVFEKTFSVFKVFDLMFLEADDTLGTMECNGYDGTRSSAGHCRRC